MIILLALAFGVVTTGVLHAVSVVMAGRPVRPREGTALAIYLAVVAAAAWGFVAALAHLRGWP